MHIKSRANDVDKSARADLWSTAERGTRELLIKHLIAAGTVIIVSMALLTYLISSKVSALVTHYVAQETTAAISTDLSPLVQGLTSTTALSESQIAQIDAIKAKNKGLHAIKIWLRDGTLVYASDRRKIGQRFQNPTLDQAFAGNVVATYDDLASDENHDERRLNTPLIEVYAPIFANGTKDVIAVGEYYKDASRLYEELRLIWIAIAGLVSAVTLPMIILLYFLTRHIEKVSQQARIALQEKAELASALALHNQELRKAAEAARQESVKSNEQLLQQIGQDLHDGPIQTLSVMALRLSSVPISPSDGNDIKDALATATELTNKTLTVLRDISSGLVLPELETLDPEEAVELAIREHEAVSGTKVERSVGTLPKHIARALKICLFRVVQEGLNNALRHADGRGQKVSVHMDRETISVSISDRGPGHTQSKASPRTASLGLLGLKRRVAVLQGTLEFESRETGSELRAKLPVIRTD